MNEERINQLVDEIVKFSDSCIMDRFDLVAHIKNMSENELNKFENDVTVAIDTDNLEYLIEIFE